MVGPVGVVAWAELRRRWVSVALLTVALGLTGAVVLSSIAGGRRGREALDEFVAYSEAGTMEVFVNPELPPEEQVRLLQRVIETSGEPSFAALAAVVVALPGPDGARGDGTDLLVSQALIDGPLLDDTSRPIVVDGDLPLRQGEVAINETVRDRRDVGVGDPLDLAVFARAEIDSVGNGIIPEPVAVEQLTVGAVIRQPIDLARSPQSQPDTVYEADESRIVIHPSFLEGLDVDVATYGVGAVGHPPVADIPALTRAMRREGGRDVLVNPAAPEDLTRLQPVGDAIDLESNALLAVATVVLLFGLVVVGTAAARVTADDADDREVLLSIGLTPRQLATARLLRGVLIAVLATVLAVAIAVPASSLFPIGLAGEAEIDPGIQIDLPVLLVGGAVFLTFVMTRLTLGEWADRRRAASPPRRRTLGLLNGPLSLGARLTLDGVRGRSGAATRVALGTAILGVAAVAGASTYAASMDRLLGSPERQGWIWDVAVGNFFDAENAEEAAAALADNPDVADFVGYNWSTFTVDGETVALAEVSSEGSDLLPVVLEGRAPGGDDEVALGRGTLDQLDRSIGDRIQIAADGDPVDAEIVGVVVAPAVISTSMDLDSGGVTTFDLTARAFGDQPNATAVSSYLVGFRDDVDREAAIERVREDFPGTVLGPMKPLDVADLERVRGVPYLLAGMLGALALLSVVIALTTAARRRRRDIAVLRSVGLARSQLRRLLAGEATTFLLLALALGLPIGVVIGRLAWSLAADGLGSEVGPVVPLFVIAAASLVVLVAANLFGQWLALVVGHRRPGTDLRTE